MHARIKNQIVIRAFDPLREPDVFRVLAQVFGLDENEIGGMIEELRRNHKERVRLSMPLRAYSPTFTRDFVAYLAKNGIVAVFCFAEPAGPKKWYLRLSATALASLCAQAN